MPKYGKLLTLQSSGSGSAKKKWPAVSSSGIYDARQVHGDVVKTISVGEPDEGSSMLLLSEQLAEDEDCVTRLIA